MNQKSIIVKCDNCGTKNRIPESRLNDKPVCGKCRAPMTVLNGSGVPLNVTDKSFGDEVLSFSGTVLVDCWAPWCGPCRIVAPVMDQIAAEYRGRLKVAKLNTDENPVTASKYGIQSIPTILIFKNGKQVNRIMGAVPKTEIERYLSGVL